jgi:Concanavalin A-like lectin/glucanases superfamily
VIIVPNHHVVVPVTHNESAFLPHEITSDVVKRRARIVRKYMNNEDTIILDFIPVSDLWIEIYLEGHRILNPHYLTRRTQAYAYEVYNVRNNEIFFTHPITGNVKVVCDTLTHTQAEITKIPGTAGLHIDFQNLQSYDTYEQVFVPTRYSNNYYNLPVTQLKLRVGDALYSAPYVLCEPCYGYVRPSKNRKELVYVPRKNFKGYDVFTYTLMTQHGQMGPPASFTIKVVEDESQYWYNYSGEFSGIKEYLVLPEVHRTHLGVIAGKKLTIEFFFFTKKISDKANYRVGMFGQHSTAGIFGRYSIYLQGYSVSGTQQVVFRYGIYKTDANGNSYHDVYRISSKQRLKQLKWHFVSIMIDSSIPNDTIIIMAIDGEIETFTEQDFTAQTAETGYPFYIGAIFGCESQNFDGYLSNFRITMNRMLYTTGDYQVPIRPLTTIIDANVLTFTNNVISAHSVQNWASPVLIPKIGDIDIVNIGPFSPSVLQVSNKECMSGDSLVFYIENDFICSGTFLPWTIKVNAAPKLVGNVSNYSGSLSVDFVYVDDINQVIIPNTNELQKLQGNFIVDEIDQVKVTVTNAPAFLTRTSFKFSLDTYPLMYRTVLVYADPDGLVLNLNTANISSYLGYVNDLVNFNHGFFSNLASYSSSFGGIYTFDGATNFIQGNTSIAIDQTGDITCDLWFRINAPSFGNVRMFGKGNITHTTYELGYNTISDTMFYRRSGYTEDVKLEYKSNVAIIGSWINLVAVTDKYLHKIYLNGNLIARTYTDTLEFKSNPDGYVIGKSSYGDYHNGDFSVCKLYRRALSNVEIENSFASSKARYGL